MIIKKNKKLRNKTADFHAYYIKMKSCMLDFPCC